MTSISKSRIRSNNKSTPGAVKEKLKDFVKPSLSTPAIAYSCTIGTFHQPEKTVHCNGISHNDDNCDAHSGSSGTGPEYDSVSNNGSYSDESEDPKEKVVSNIVDLEKREKIRLRNEKKYQRQRERRARLFSTRTNVRSGSSSHVD